MGGWGQIPDRLRAARVNEGPRGVNFPPRHFCWRARGFSHNVPRVLTPLETTPTRRLLSEVLHPRLSLFDDSGTRERQAALSGRIAEYAIITLVVMVLAGMEIARWRFQTKPQPVLFSFVAVCLAGYAALRIFFIWRQISVLRREQQARQNLRNAIEEICGRGWLLFDGIVDRRGHLLGSVLAGPGGLVTLIPRFIARGGNLRETIVRGEGDALLIGGHKILADPVGQARSAARALYEGLAAAGMETVPVQAAVVFPGWSIKPGPEDTDEEVWILSDRDLLSRIMQEPTVLEAKDLIGVSLYLEGLAGH